MEQNVIKIEFHKDLGSDLLDKLRYTMELCVWRKRWRVAKERKDFDAMDWLDKEFEYLGLP